ncbi:phosphodiesterase [Rodentibacter caecimuris]|uniref:Phosphodiesterase n=1 Tax=Rodentibacter caecimuris TaxID=1796644 RepID=A0ABX3KY80_9PAST|nr:phosphodiesterase [Rodentibacter heylii]
MLNIYKPTFLISLLHPFNKKKRQELRHQNHLNIFHKFAPSAIQMFFHAVSLYSKPIKIWLEFGTLLGFYREKQLIQHDIDIDFGIDECDINDDLIEHLKEYGFSLSRKFIIESNKKELNNFNAEYTFKYGKYVSIDLFVFKKFEDQKICYSFDREEGLEHKDTLIKYNNRLRTVQISLSHFDLIETKFFDTNVYIPNNIASHLQEIYGHDFMTPRIYDYENRIKDFEKILDNKTLGRKLEFK